MNEDWDKINNIIDESKIFRFKYKKMLGESLTSFITKRIHLTNEEIRNDILREQEVKIFLKRNPSYTPKFLDNIEISISARRAEQGAFINRNNEEVKNNGISS